MGSLVQGEEAVRNGASFITHLFNAMLPVSFAYKNASFSDLIEMFFFLQM